MHHTDNGTTTDLYLVRIWRGKPVDDTLTLHGKLQHVVSGASCHFEGLMGLPHALEEMMEQQTHPFVLDTGSLAPNGPDEELKA